MGEMTAALFRDLAADAAEEAKMFEALVDSGVGCPSATGRFGPIPAAQTKVGQLRLFQLMMLRAANFMDWHYTPASSSSSIPHSSTPAEKRLAQLGLTMFLTNADFRMGNEKKKKHKHVSTLVHDFRIYPDQYDRGVTDGQVDEGIQEIYDWLNKKGSKIFGCGPSSSAKGK